MTAEDERELQWWRHFATRFDTDAAPPPPGSRLLSRQMRIIDGWRSLVATPHGTAYILGLNAGWHDPDTPIATAVNALTAAIAPHKTTPRPVWVELGRQPDWNWKATQ